MHVEHFAVLVYTKTLKNQCGLKGNNVTIFYNQQIMCFLLINKVYGITSIYVQGCANNFILHSIFKTPSCN